MNWRPASPFDACLANELVDRAAYYASWEHARGLNCPVTAAILHDGFEVPFDDIGLGFGIHPTQARQLRDRGIQLFKRALSPWR